MVFSDNIIERIIILRQQPLSVDEIMAELNIPADKRNSVEYICKKQSPLTKEQISYLQNKKKAKDVNILEMAFKEYFNSDRSKDSKNTICNKYNLNTNTFSSYMQKHHKGELTTTNSSLFTAGQMDEVIRLRKELKSTKEIAIIVNIPLSAVKNICNHKVKLSKEELLFIRNKDKEVIPTELLEAAIAEFHAGVSKNEVCQKYNIPFNRFSYYIVKTKQTITNLEAQTRAQAAAKHSARPEYRIYNKDLEEKVIKLYLQGLSREAIATQLNVKFSWVKTILFKNQAKRDATINNQNAYSAKLAKNPNAMEDMRSAITPESIEKIREKVTKTWANPELRKAQSVKIQNWINQLTPEERAIKYYRENGILSYKVKAILKNNDVESMDLLMQQIALKRNGKFIGPYVHSKEKTEWECSQNHRFLAIPNSVQMGHWCPRCANKGPSKEQLEIFEFIKQYIPNAEIESNKLWKRSLDIYCPKHFFAVEFNGLYWHCSLFKESGTHYKKYKACVENNIMLFAIFEDEWSNKKDLIKSMLLRKLNLFKGIKLNARELELKFIKRGIETKSFFDCYHLDGYVNCKYAYGLYSGSKLVACASFRVNFNNEFELARFATDFNYNVRGAAGKLLSCIKQPLVSFSNNRFSNGNIYRKLGFELISDIGPSYWYTDGNKRIWRFRCRKLNDPEITNLYPTEKEQAENGIFSQKIFGDNRPLYRIEDYGHKKWIRK